MITLHRRHHNAKTHHTHRIGKADDGTWHWVTPTGHTYTLHPAVLDTIRLLHDNPENSQPPGSHDPPEDHEPPPF